MLQINKNGGVWRLDSKGIPYMQILIMQLSAEITEIKTPAGRAGVRLSKETQGEFLAMRRSHNTQFRAIAYRKKV
jgi:hypothetical protein